MNGIRWLLVDGVLECLLVQGAQPRGEEFFWGGKGADAQTQTTHARTHGPLGEDGPREGNVALQHEGEGLLLLRRRRAEVHLLVVGFRRWRHGCGGRQAETRTHHATSKVVSVDRVARPNGRIGGDEETRQPAPAAAQQHVVLRCASRRWCRPSTARPSPGAGAGRGGSSSSCLIMMLYAVQGAREERILVTVSDEGGRGSGASRPSPHLSFHARILFSLSHLSLSLRWGPPTVAAAAAAVRPLRRLLGDGGEQGGRALLRGLVVDDGACRPAVRGKQGRTGQDREAAGG